MKLLIRRGTSVENVKKSFSNCYPFLKIELYKAVIDGQLTHLKKESLPSNLAFDKLIKNSDETVIDIGKAITVAELENQFANIGLGAEVFRKSGTVWIETSLTDNWTLQQQNTEAEELDLHFN